MTNHNPNITSSNATGGFSENTNTTGSGALHLVSGTMNFKDSDHNDTHTTSASLKSAVLSTGSVIPANSLAAIAAAMSSTILTDSNSNGKLKWSFSAADEEFDFLAKNQKLTLTYEIKLFDNHGGMTKKLVTITVTGTDDKPLIDFGVNAVVTEQAGQTLSFVPDTAVLAIHFADPDLTNIGHTATVIDVEASGATVLPGALGEAILRSFLHINNVVKTSGSSNGTINATFSAPDLMFDYLAEGEALDITYTIRLNDNAGLTSTQTVTITVIGTNDAPIYLSGPDTEHLTEGEDLSPAGDLTASGDFLFADIDLLDDHTVSTSVTASRSGGGAVPLTEAELLAALTTDLDPDSTGHLLGEVDWSFALDNDDVAFLNSGETLTITYTVTITDDAGGTDTQTITVTILGTNDPVVVTSGPGAASLAEFADTTGSAALNTTTPVPTGAIAFTDTDLGDTHTVLVSVVDAVWSGGPAIPSGTQADLPTALLTTLNDSTGTGSGSIDWTFSIPDLDLDFLAFGETLTVTYDVAVSDGPTSDSQTVTITVDGANDATVVTSGPGAGAVEELADTSGSTELDTATGTIAFDDVDLNDMHTVGVAVSSVVWSTGDEAPALDYVSALMTTLNDSTGSGTGSVDWTFAIEDRFVDFLGAGETLTITYDVTVSDGFTGSTQTVAITVTGAADPLTVNPLATTAFDTTLPDDGQIIAAGNVILDAGDSGGDLNVSLGVTEVEGSAGNVGVFVAGTYGSVFIGPDGTYQYIANASVDPLQAGEEVVDTFSFTVTDSLNRSETTTLTITVSGSNDAPVIVTADSTGSMTEDLGPSTTVNGDFETGNLAGWSADPTISVEFVGLGGEFGNYAAKLAPTAVNASLSQSVATTPGQLYTVSFFISGDAESTNNAVTVTWDGVTLVTISDNFSGGLTRYSFDVLANGTFSTTDLTFTYFDEDGIVMYIDQVTVEGVTGPPTESADGSITFSDIETGDTHTAIFAPLGMDYVGTFTLDPVSESSGSGSLDWHFVVDNADIQFLAQGQALTQTYMVSVIDDEGASVTQDVTITINGKNDAPTLAVDDTIITNAGEDGGVFIPGWVLGRNDIDPDTADVLTLNSITGSTGGNAIAFGGALFFDDTTLGGSFTYDATDGFAASAPGTATIVNTAATNDTLTGTGDDDIIVDASGGSIAGGVTLDGGGGNDILLGYSGAHTLTGGSGDDIFAFETVPDALNTITDFDNVGENDLVAISSSAFGSGLTAGMDASLVFESSADAEFFGSLFHYDMTANVLYFSFDGTTASAVQVAQFQSGVVLNGNDLLIV